MERLNYKFVCKFYLEREQKAKPWKLKLKEMVWNVHILTMYEIQQN